MTQPTTIYTRPVLLTAPDGMTTPAVMLLDADGSMIRLLDAQQIESFLSSVRTCAHTAIAAHEQQASASPSDRRLLQVQPEGRA